METAFWVLLVLGILCALAFAVCCFAGEMDGMVVFLVMGSVCFLAAMVIASIEDAREWKAFAEAHTCKVVGQMSGSVFNTVGIGSNGQPVIGIGSTPSKTGYQCNNGVTYWR